MARYENYQISICGSVRNSKTKRILQPGVSIPGYYFVNLFQNRKMKIHYIHQLVAIHFIPNIYNTKCIDHRNNNRLDNTISNLRWVSYQQNSFNSLLSSKNTTGSKGIYFNKKTQKWYSQIRFNYKLIHIGHFVNFEDAKIARKKKALELFGNFINSCEKI